MDNKEIFDSWFKDHVAKHSVFRNNCGEEIERIVWGKPGTNIDRIIFTLDKTYRNLIVSGDLGEAIYHWNGPITGFGFFNNMDIQYFESKCLASENGKRDKEWDPESAKLSFKDILTNLFEPDEDREDEEEYDQKKAMEEFAEEKYKEIIDEYSESIFDCEYSYMDFLENYGAEELGSDYYECSNIGMVISLRCHSYLTGLNMACKQLGIC